MTAAYIIFQEIKMQEWIGHGSDAQEAHSVTEVKYFKHYNARGKGYDFPNVLHAEQCKCHVFKCNRRLYRDAREEGCLKVFEMLVFCSITHTFFKKCMWKTQVGKLFRTITNEKTKKSKSWLRLHSRHLFRDYKRWVWKKWGLGQCSSVFNSIG